jgi:hypothetical protein
MRVLKLTAGIAALAVLASATAIAQNGQQGQPAGSPTGLQRTQQQQVQRQQQRQADRATTNDRTMDHARMQARERDQSRQQAHTTVQDKSRTMIGVYGGNLMTADERSRYRAQWQAMQTEQERTEFEARHREEIQSRAREQGIEPLVTQD